MLKNGKEVTEQTVALNIGFAGVFLNSSGNIVRITWSVIFIPILGKPGFFSDDIMMEV